MGTRTADAKFGVGEYHRVSDRLDRATAAWTKAQSDVRYWQKQVEQSNHPKAIDQLRMAQHRFNQACEERMNARKEAQGTQPLR